MTIDEALDWIHSRLKFGSRPGLDRVLGILELLDNPQDKLSLIHIAGTNGKGSTTTFVRNIFTQQGLKVGSFTSPYIEKFNERIAIDGVGISDAKLVEYVKRVQPIVEKMDADENLSGITEFELITAIGFLYFLEEKVDLAVIEVGLGGLLDSTNVIKPVVSGITTIGLDHIDILGNTIEEIAFQKAGIIKENIPVVTGNIQSSPLQVIKNVASKHHAPIYEFGKDYQIQPHTLNDWGEKFDFTSDIFTLPELKTSLLGQHQVENAAMAVELSLVYAQKMNIDLSPEAIRKGILTAFWPARMERLSENPLIILDGAHNVHAIERLIENIQKEFAGRNIRILFAALDTKDISEMLEKLRGLDKAQIYLTTFDYPNALRLDEYQDMEDENLSIVSNWQFGIAEILEKMEPEDVFLITGSLYFSSQVREFFVGLGE